MGKQHERDWWGRCLTCGLEKPLGEFPTISTIAGPVDELEVCPDCYPTRENAPSYTGYVSVFEKRH